jgi:type IV pilus assembly protein PilE
MKLQTQKAFSLLELMIALAIVAIIATIAVPSYQKYTYLARRQGAIADLLKLSLFQERYRITHDSYASEQIIKDQNGGQLPISTSGNYYSFNVSGTSATTYTLTATASSTHSQDQDTVSGTPCSVLTLDAQGNKSPAACWPS